MVRKGSTVRVRQRASETALQSGFLVSGAVWVTTSPVTGGVAASVRQRFLLNGLLFGTFRGSALGMVVCTALGRAPSGHRSIADGASLIRSTTKSAPGLLETPPGRGRAARSAGPAGPYDTWRPGGLVEPRSDTAGVAQPGMIDRAENLCARGPAAPGEHHHCGSGQRVCTGGQFSTGATGSPLDRVDTEARATVGSRYDNSAAPRGGLRRASATRRARRSAVTSSSSR
jgi:hypothetical protein